MIELDKLKEVFLTDVDEETRQQNAEDIAAWEAALLKNEHLASWLDNPVTQEIIKKARETYREATIQLGTDRELLDRTKCLLWGRQDAALWLLSFASADPKAEIERIRADIKRALDITSA